MPDEAQQRSIDLAEVVDEFVDELGVDRLEAEADRFEIPFEELLGMIRNEALARLSGMRPS